LDLGGIDFFLETVSALVSGFVVCFEVCLSSQLEKTNTEHRTNRNLINAI
jgi:hypothetical protein